MSTPPGPAVPGAPDPYSSPTPYGSPESGAQDPYGAPAQDPYGAPAPHAYGPPSQPDFPGNPGYEQQRPPGTNGFAIAALVFGIIGGFILGFIFGFIALSKTKKTGQAGRGMAIAGLILSGVWTVIWAAIIIFGVVLVKTVLNTSGAPAYGLTVGDCFNQNPSSLSQVDKTSCTTPHDGETVALIPVTGTTYPGETVLEQQANTECPAPAKSYLGPDADPSKLSLAFLAPNQLAWSAGNHTIACFVGSPAGKLTAPAVQH